MIFKKNKHLQPFKNKTYSCNLESYKFTKIKQSGIVLPIKQLNPRAFSLLEMSLVLIIVSVILSSGLNIATSNLENARNNVTKERIKEVYKSLGVFLATNERLPCPSSLNLKESDLSYGTEPLNSNGNCADDPNNRSFSSDSNPNIIIGGIPNKALNLGSDFAKDGFGNRLFYIVDKNFTNTVEAKKVGDSDFLEISEKVNINQVITKKVRLVIFSTGANGKGGVVASNSTKITKSTDAEEAENDVPLASLSTNTINFDKVLFSRSEGSENFDDIMFYRTRNQILQDANLLDFLECQTISLNLYTWGTWGSIFTWPTARYNEIMPSSNSCPTAYSKGVLKPTKRCGLFGQWQDGYINPCQN